MYMTRQKRHEYGYFFFADAIYNVNLNNPREFASTKK